MRDQNVLADGFLDGGSHFPGHGNQLGIGDIAMNRIEDIGGVFIARRDPLSVCPALPARHILELAVVQQAQTKIKAMFPGHAHHRVNVLEVGFIRRGRIVIEPGPFTFLIRNGPILPSGDSWWQPTVESFGGNILGHDSRFVGCVSARKWAIACFPARKQGLRVR